MKTCTAAIAAMLLYKSWQRPGAVRNATLAEYLESKELKVVRVINDHKLVYLAQLNSCFCAL